jgi:hypothetical protein
MRYLLATSWLLAAAAWVSAFFTLAATLGGARPIGRYMEEGSPAILNIAMAILSLGVAFCLLRRATASRSLAILALAGALLHLSNSLYLHLASLGAPGFVLSPLGLIAALLPTNPVYMSGLVGNGQLFQLPFAAVALSVGTLLFKQQPIPSEA